MTDHILNRSLAPAQPKQPAPPKPTPEQAKAIQQMRKTKQAEAVARALERGRR